MMSRALFYSASFSLQSLNKRAAKILSGIYVLKSLRAPRINKTLISMSGPSLHPSTIWVGLTKKPTRSSCQSSSSMSVAAWKITLHLLLLAPSILKESLHPSECRNAESFYHQNRPSRYHRRRSGPWSWTLCSHRSSHVKYSLTKHLWGTALQ